MNPLDNPNHNQSDIQVTAMQTESSYQTSNLFVEHENRARTTAACDECRRYGFDI